MKQPPFFSSKKNTPSVQKKTFNPQKKHQNSWENLEKNHIIWGKHSVLSALANPHRNIYEIFCLKPELLSDVKKALEKRKDAPSLHTKITESLLHQIPNSAHHHGIFVKTDIPQSVPLEYFSPHQGPLLVLDQMTDPHNVGALWRSAAAFGVQGLILTKNNSARLDGVVAKTSAGAMDCIPYHQATNLARTLELLKKMGFFIVGLDEEPDATMASVGELENLDLSPLALVVGSEGKGLRPLTKSYCHHCVFISCHPRWNVLNASVAGAIAMHHLFVSSKNS